MGPAGAAAALSSHGDRPAAPQQQRRHPRLDLRCFETCNGVNKGNWMFICLKLHVHRYTEVERMGCAAEREEAA